MGMAASQARLLTITARIHDVEYQAQSIQNAKVQLATQSDQVYQEYLEALDATTLTIKDWQGHVMTANFNNLCGKNAVDSTYQYALLNSKNKLIVSEEIKQGYDYYNEKIGYDDPYAFAIFMLTGDQGQAIGNDKDSFSEPIENAEAHFGSTSSNDSILNLKKSLEELEAKGGDDGYNGLTEDQQKDYDELEKQYKNLLYNTSSQGIYENVLISSGVEEEDINFNQEDFDYYVNIYKQIQAAGGSCVSISGYDGENGDAASNSDWLKNMIECGKISINIVNTDSKNGDVTFSTTSPTSDTFVSYTNTTSIDKTALAKAEAEYEKATKDIDNKDKRFDMDLSKLESERTALTTEYDSVKKVISDNIERTFGIFS